MVPRGYYERRVTDRLVAEMLGMCRGILADGVVNEAEAIALAAWLRHHPDAAAGFPGREIAEWVDRCFRDGIVEVAEIDELRGMLADLVGDRPSDEAPGTSPSRLPYNDPLPTVFFEGREFVFTGHCCMPRKECERLVTDRAGRVHTDVRMQTDYLVVGSVASESWVQAAWGRKILRASEIRESAAKIAIIPESHWLEAVELGG